MKRSIVFLAIAAAALSLAQSHTSPPVRHQNPLPVRPPQHQPKQPPIYERHPPVSETQNGDHTSWSQKSNHGSQVRRVAHRRSHGHYRNHGQMVSATARRNHGHSHEGSSASSQHHTGGGMSGGSTGH